VPKLNFSWFFVIVTKRGEVSVVVSEEDEFYLLEAIGDWVLLHTLMIFLYNLHRHSLYIYSLSQKNVEIVFSSLIASDSCYYTCPEFAKRREEKQHTSPNDYTQQHKNIVILEFDYSGTTRTR
jgi:hypothetical protein